MYETTQNPNQTLKRTNIDQDLMKFIQDQYLRIIYVVAALIILGFAKYNETKITGDAPSLNTLSYWGTIATLIALIITIIEVLHSIRITKGIQAQAEQILMRARVIDSSAYLSECLSALDETNNNLSSESYTLSLKCFQYFRKSYAKLHDKSEFGVNLDKSINKTELSLQKSTHSTVDAPLTKAAKTLIHNDILAIKSILEQSRLSRSTEYVPT